MITVDDYFGPWKGHPDATVERKANAEKMLKRVNDLLERAAAEFVPLPMNPKTSTLVSGETLGGFRPQTCVIGSPGSAHKQGRAVDVYDPHGKLDEWVDDALLEEFGLYREAPDATRGWCHLSDRAPGSGRRTFNP